MCVCVGGGGGGFAIGPDFTLFLVNILFGSHFTGEERAGCIQIFLYLHVRFHLACPCYFTVCILKI